MNRIVRRCGYVGNARVGDSRVYGPFLVNQALLMRLLVARILGLVKEMSFYGSK
jgi:hypothetical protein